MASFKAKFPVLQELFAKNHRGALCPPPSGARVKSRYYFTSTRGFGGVLCAISAPGIREIKAQFSLFCHLNITTRI